MIANADDAILDDTILTLQLSWLNNSLLNIDC